MAKYTHRNQHGASALGTVMMLAVLGYGVFLGIQWVPQKIQNMSLDSILESLESKQKQFPMRSIREVESTLDALLGTNNLTALKDNFKVMQSHNSIAIEVSREWKFNLIYAEKAMRYEKSLLL